MSPPRSDVAVSASRTAPTPPTLLTRSAAARVAVAAAIAAALWLAVAWALR